ncbi:hypothetical protein [Synechococcus sp. RedBA-s]|uniref:hypothetical protein n=1 Tax=Synechococcus sp. RedBA-s TaxID=2823741 RepID=UPI0020CC5063|nr:hypothetical protein [Synechococcus sp. RedBA-s]MCP9801187.1 hypothetical protein [Synechococcus sp. RedBA-s]
MRAPLAFAAAGLLAISLPAAGALAQVAIESQRVTFRAGADSTLLTGQLKGDQTIDYKLRAGAGQTLTVELKGSNPQNYFNVLAAGTDTAVFIGSSSGNRFSGLLPSDGDVRVRVYLMRPAARRNETSTYSLKVGIGGAPLAPVSASRDALIPGTPYHASAAVPCVSGSSGKGSSCKASVIRRANNSATVVVTIPGGQKRQFLFVKGKAVASDQPEKLSVQRRGDVSVLTLGENFERYEIVDAFVVGG